MTLRWAASGDINMKYQYLLKATSFNAEDKITGITEQELNCLDEEVIQYHLDLHPICKQGQLVIVIKNMEN